MWLTRNQIAELFDRDIKTIDKYINNALKEEVDNSTVAKFATTQKDGQQGIERLIEYYNLVDMILSISSVKSNPFPQDFHCQEYHRTH